MEIIAFTYGGNQRFRWVQKTIRQNCWGKTIMTYLLTRHNSLPQEAANLQIAQRLEVVMMESITANLPYPYIVLYTTIPGHCQ